jgi:hypothetical protein
MTDGRITEAQLAYILKKCADKNAFFIETIELPDYLEPVSCGLFGPLTGDVPVLENEVTYAKRGDRAWESRLVGRPPRWTNQVTVIGGPFEDLPCILYTAYGGPLAPQEPGDPGCRDVEASKKFWAEHALSDS